jgi:hypothetical protein
MNLIHFLLELFYIESDIRKRSLVRYLSLKREKILEAL